MILVFVSEVLNSRRIWQYWLFEWGSHPPCVWWHDFRTSYKEWIKLWKSISGSREQMEVKMYFYTSSSHQPSKISQLADQGNSAEWCHGTLEIRKRAFCYTNTVVFEDISALLRGKWASNLYWRKMRMHSFFKKKNWWCLTCYTMIQGVGNWRHFILL